MYTYKAIVATGLPDSNGNQFHPDVFKQIIEADKTVPVTINFNKESIGKASNFELTNSGELYCCLDVNIPNLNELNVFAVPGGYSNIQDLEKSNDNKITFIKKYTLTEISITSKPADQSISSIDMASE